VPAVHGKYAIVHKDYVLDYASPLKDTLMEYEGGNSGLTYRYTYGLEKNSAVIYGIHNYRKSRNWGCWLFKVIQQPLY
jgi:hypothetical protein